MDEKLAPEGGQPEGAEVETPESQPAPGGDDHAQQQQPDPFLGITDEQVRERYTHLFQADGEQQWEQGRREGQGAARTEIAAIRKQLKGEEADRITYERLERMKASDDPDAKEAYWRERDNSDTDAAYKRGKETANRPQPEVLEKMQQGVANDFLTELDAHLNDCKELKGLSDEEKESLAKEKHPTLGALVDAKIDLIANVRAAAGTAKVVKEKEEAAVAKLRDEYREKGIEGPEEIEGATAGDDESAVLAGSATGEQKTDAFERKHGYKPKGR